MARLGARDAVRLGAACRGFRALAAEATPGLLLSLYPHQVRRGLMRASVLRFAKLVTIQKLMIFLGTQQPWCVPHEVQGFSRQERDSRT